MDNKNLNPCPFCGSVNLTTNHCNQELYSHAEEWLYYVSCMKCEGKGGYGSTREESHMKWNMRFVANIQVAQELPVSIGNEYEVISDTFYWLHDEETKNNGALKKGDKYKLVDRNVKKAILEKEDDGTIIEVYRELINVETFKMV
ncbi:Lar family restriction alleviation protein [Breznakia pachnodae]|uniref:Uncharacterized protein n=1 Tax=Breznakia pachnodae TaxID=265178 RepID=A0ABU0E6G9_9FIRM|nr:Lar family restriction alleviation protein [Breznakia pachnodae]MDQ0362508.1 hypothetical protein [Breznakia pachnodae]